MVYEKLIKIKEKYGTGYMVLVDPDKISTTNLEKKAELIQENGADVILLGGSTLITSEFEDYVRRIKAAVDLPVILFPGDYRQIAKGADAILFLSLISGRNANYLIEEQVRGAYIIRSYGIEPIGTGYMLIESGKVSTVEYVSRTRPVPRDKINLACVHALAAQYLGMKMVYLEAGSGAPQSVPDEMTTAVSGFVEIPVIVGGGIKNPKEAEKKAKSGASFVVTGNALEGSDFAVRIKEFAHAIHGAKA
ncbi:MAG: geranylgeranylglyceryl/heptaprenylglyceryl phosphate synthase [bacterium]